MTKEDRKRLDQLSQTIFDKKGFNILALDVRGLSTMTDYFIIAEGTVGRHAKAIATAIKHMMDEQQNALLNCDGSDDGEWIVMDYGDVVIHLFTPDMREKYALEQLWNHSKIVDVRIDVSKVGTQ